MRRNEKSLNFTVQAGDKCNRGCSHCLSSAMPSGCAEFNPEWAKRLAKESKDLGYSITVCITGGGEPLMSNNLYSLIYAFCKAKNCRGMSLVTSGFLPGAESERQLFLKVLNSRIGKHIHYCLSFNNYSKDFPVRI